MATDKTTKGKDSGGGCRTHARNSGLMALESRVLFSAAPLVGDLPGPESANDGTPAIEASLFPGDKPGVDLGQINNLVPTPPVPGLVPTPEKHITHHQSKDAHLNPIALKKHTHSIINPDSMRPADTPEGSNPTPHPMPVPELSDSVSKRRLEHGPGLHDSVFDSVMVINPDSMRPTDAQWIGISPIPTPTPGGGSVMVLNPDSMRPIDTPEGSNPTPHPMPVPELSDSVSRNRLEHGPGLLDSVLDSVRAINPDSMRPIANGYIKFDGIKGEA